MEITACWTGKAVSQNRKYGTRVIRLKETGKLRALIYETAEHRKFKEDLTWCLKGRGNILAGKVDVSIRICLVDGADTDGPEKAAVDALAPSGVLKNDRQVRHIFLWRSYHERGEMDTIEYTIRSVGGGTE